jgi:hypothetical protein
MLSQIDMPNEMSYTGYKPSCPALFNINQVSNNCPLELESEAGKHDDDTEGNFDEGLAHSKKHPEDDIGMRVNTHNRRSFAQNALYRSETKMLHQDIGLGYGSEEDCYSDSGEFEAVYSHESSMNFSNTGQFHDSPHIVSMSH